MESSISVKGRLSSSHKKEEAEIAKKVFMYFVGKYGQEQGAKKMQSCWEVMSGICVGDTFPSIEVTNLQGAKTKVEHKSGDIMLVDIWATWCGYCLDPMQENVNIMANNKDFASKKISIVGISSDQEFSKWKSFVATKKWNTIPQYNNSQAMSIVGIRGIPCILIVGKDGKVLYQGYPGNCDVETSLKNLSDGKPIIKNGGDEDSEEKDQNPFWDEIDAETKKTFITDCTKILTSNGLKDLQFLVNSSKTTNLATGKVTSNNVPILFGFVTQNQVDAVDIVLMEIQSTYNFTGIRPNIRLKQ